MTDAWSSWLARGASWPQDRAWAEARGSLAEAWRSDNGPWVVWAARRLEFWDGYEAAHDAWLAAKADAAHRYDADKRQHGQGKAMEIHAGRVAVADAELARGVRAVVPLEKAEAALASWWANEQRIEARNEANRARNGGVFRGLDFWTHERGGWQ